MLVLHLKRYFSIFLILFTAIFSTTQAEVDFKKFDLLIEVERENGKSQSLKEVISTFKDQKKPVLLYFWASWCPDCVAESPYLAGFLEKYSDKVSMIYMSVDKNRVDWKKRKRDTSMGAISVRYPTGWDDKKFRESINLNWIPRYILMKTDGEVIYPYAIKIQDSELLKVILSLK